MKLYQPQPAPRAAARLTRLALLMSLSLVLQAAPSFTPANQPTGWIGQSTVTNHDITSGSESVFRGSYDLSNWSGNVFALDIDASGELQSSSPWASGNAAKEISSQNYLTGRKIVTRNASGTGVPFLWASLSASQQTLLGDATNGPKILNYLRGDRSNEDPSGNKYRLRPTNLMMGPVIHSNLAYWAAGNRLVVGANDGMVHVLNSSSGAEVFAYVPSMLMGSLKNLSLSYDSASATRDYYVDGGISVAQALIGASYKTYAVGGLGAGGKGLWALDLTNPSPASESAAAGMIAWEITNASSGYANLGYSYSRPRLGRLSSGEAAAIVGNGYMNSGNYHAVLYVINLTDGTKLRELDTGVGSAGSPNGLSTPTPVDTNGDGKVDYVYAGDLDGNLWKFDLTSNPGTVSKLHATSPAQSITNAPSVATHPEGGVMVCFGTGRMLSSTDTADTAKHYAYCVRDGGSGTGLVDRTLSDASYTYAGNTTRLRTGSSTDLDWTVSKGWKLELRAGERVLGDLSFIDDKRYYFASTNPTVVNAQLPNGENWLNEPNYLNGGTDGRLIFDLNSDIKIDSSDRIQFAGSPVTGAAGIPISKHIGAGVTSQPLLVDELVLATTLFSTNADVYIEPPSTEERGVSGGHFDVDIYYAKSGTFKGQKHFHEYDDTFDVTGVNMLNASSTTLNMSNVPTTTDAKMTESTKYKVLVNNQYMSPAVVLSVGGRAYESVKTFDNLASQTDAATLLAALPVYNGKTPTSSTVVTGSSLIRTLIYKMPLDAFKSKDWWGNGDARPGLIPTQTGCVNKTSGKSSSSSGFDDQLGTSPTGKESAGHVVSAPGLRHNGALVIQVIKDTTPAADIELSVPSKPEYGWRVKTAKFYTDVLVEWTTFWHHPNGGCYKSTDTKWVLAAPEDTVSDAKSATPAAGSADPSDGSFSGGGSVVSVNTTVVGNVTTVTTTWSDGSWQIVVSTVNDDGTTTIDISDSSGGHTVQVVPTQGTTSGSGGEQSKNANTRISWRELVR